MMLFRKYVLAVLLVNVLLLSVGCDSADTADDEDDDPTFGDTTIELVGSGGKLTGSATWIKLGSAVTITCIFEDGDVTAIITLLDDQIQLGTDLTTSFTISEALAAGAAAVQITNVRGASNFDSTTLTEGNVFITEASSTRIKGVLEGTGVPLAGGAVANFKVYFDARRLL